MLKTFQEALDEFSLNESQNEKSDSKTAKLFAGCIDKPSIFKAVKNEFQSVSIYKTFDVYIKGFEVSTETVVKCLVTYVYDDEDGEDVFMVAELDYLVKSQKIKNVEVSDYSNDGETSKQAVDKIALKLGGIKV